MFLSILLLFSTTIISSLADPDSNLKWDTKCHMTAAYPPQPYDCDDCDDVCFHYLQLQFYHPCAQPQKNDKKHVSHFCSVVGKNYTKIQKLQKLQH